MKHQKLLAQTRTLVDLAYAANQLALQINTAQINSEIFVTDPQADQQHMAAMIKYYAELRQQLVDHVANLQQFE